MRMGIYGDGHARNRARDRDWLAKAWSRRCDFVMFLAGRGRGSDSRIAGLREQSRLAFARQ
ncbi:hypothetical protein HETIRDRAFT_170387 [Heterobasidion irregulare TC 32-1]|uniref:Uncharacterized protein n=1 Tax=Heterobasidion irregulare (strain TC 32-1) TaxID=747525 RepID=W4KDI5_HETIT|nr:uncharacterized protein HETIRDRAFT_170387 [Heterobasidion irregulare TC 32-1]ETW83917.1 hypothetical protein HETIRDRAFT_170387 [Heterobasidion irregulare TC 32-1]